MNGRIAPGEYADGMGTAAQAQVVAMVGTQMARGSAHWHRPVW